MGSDDYVTGRVGTDCWQAGFRTHIAAHSEGGGFVRGCVFLLFVCFFSTGGE